jgi:hypothetical protein
MKMPQPPSPNEPASLRRLALAALTALPLAAASPSIGAATASAAPSRLIGHWRAIDGESDTPYAIVEFLRTPTGTLSGFLRSVLPGADQPAAAGTCDKCTGARKGAPIVGMEIIWNLRPDGDRFVDGSIVDPESGRIFRCLVRVFDRGGRLDLTIYERFAIFGVTEHWERSDAAR